MTMRPTNEVSCPLAPPPGPSAAAADVRGSTRDSPDGDDGDASDASAGDDGDAAAVVVVAVEAAEEGGKCGG